MKFFRSREFQLVEKYFYELEEEEKVYLSLHLLGSRVSVVTDKFFLKIEPINQYMELQNLL